ncbi:MAG: pyrroline-5-carboxylate reductase [Lentisphaerae bacterium]|nr:pyrroline-5-carboxylate reductase [Lentisphaerota bacterium]
MKLGFVGAGKMAEAIIAAVLRSGWAKPEEIVASDKVDERLRVMSEAYKVRTTSDVREVLQYSEVVILAVKPQDMDALLTGMAPQIGENHLLVSIAAGKTLDSLRAGLGRECRLVRVMPNLAIQVGEGMSVYCCGNGALESDGECVAEIFGTAGRVVELKEELFDAVTALSGSGPAFFAYTLEAMVLGAVALGMAEETARVLAIQTMLGSARVLCETGQNPVDFIKAVASPKGTTAAGLEILEGSELQGIIAATIGAAARRSGELSQS